MFDIEERELALIALTSAAADAALQPLTDTTASELCTFAERIQAIAGGLPSH